MQIPTVVPNYRCVKCSTLYPTEAAIEKHISQEHREVYWHGCKKCGRQFKDKWHLERHELTCSADVEHICPDCNLKFKDTADLDDHRPVHFAVRVEAERTGPRLEVERTGPRLEVERTAPPVKDEEDRYTCRLCRTTLTSRSFKAHLLQHTKDLFQTNSKQSSRLDLPQLNTDPGKCKGCELTASLVDMLRTALRLLDEAAYQGAN